MKKKNSGATSILAPLVGQKNNKKNNVKMCGIYFGLYFFFLSFHTHIYLIQLLDKPWCHRCRPFLPPTPPGSRIQLFLSRIGFSNPTARRFFTERC